MHSDLLYVLGLLEIVLSYETSHSACPSAAYLYACTHSKALVPRECGLTAQFLLALNILLYYWFTTGLLLVYYC